MDKAAALKNGIQREIPPLFKDDTEYTCEIEDDLLTLSSPQQTITRLRDSLLDKLILD